MHTSDLLQWSIEQNLVCCGCCCCRINDFTFVLIFINAECSDSTGLCSKSGRKNILFGVNEVSSCQLRLDYNSFLDCSNIQYVQSWQHSVLVCVWCVCDWGSCRDVLRFIRIFMSSVMFRLACDIVCSLLLHLVYWFVCVVLFNVHVENLRYLRRWFTTITRVFAVRYSCTRSSLNARSISPGQKLFTQTGDHCSRGCLYLSIPKAQLYNVWLVCMFWYIVAKTWPNNQEHNMWED